MWQLALFDLPVDTPQARHQYTVFRTSLLKLGFTMLQFSVYARFCGNDERAEVFRRNIRKIIPKGGHVRLLSVTDVQFGKMEVYYGKKALPPEKPPEQLLLF